MSAQALAKPCAAVWRHDLVPVCPYCEAELPEIYMRSRGDRSVWGGVSSFSARTVGR